MSISYQYVEMSKAKHKHGQMSLLLGLLKSEQHSCKIHYSIYHLLICCPVFLSLLEPPRVSFHENKITFPDEAPKRLSCHCERYYPLDVTVCIYMQSALIALNIAST